MPENLQELKTYHVTYICDKCGEGEMVYGGICLATNPPQYPHECNKCQNKQTFWDVHYPCKAYKVMSEDQCN